MWGKFIYNLHTKYLPVAFFSAIVGVLALLFITKWYATFLTPYVIEQKNVIYQGEQIEEISTRRKKSSRYTSIKYVLYRTDSDIYFESTTSNLTVADKDYTTYVLKLKNDSGGVSKVLATDIGFLSNNQEGEICSLGDFMVTNKNFYDR